MGGENGYYVSIRDVVESMPEGLLQQFMES
jgi:hypothetical protein